MAKASPKGSDRQLAAGGIVWRQAAAEPEVAVVHRPRYNDWSLPKGKLHAGEHELRAAVREVCEETGFSVAVDRRAGTTKYVVEETRKKVNYWSMRYVGGQFVPNREVDALAWSPAKDAMSMLSYDNERELLADWTSTPVPDSLILLVRHAKAGRRGDWHGDDRLRPLDANGQEQADELATLLALFEPTAVWSADLLRCEQTIAPLAEKLGLSLQVESAFADDNYQDGPEGTALRLLSLAKPGQVSVVCSQGDTIPALIDQLGTGIRSSETKKGAWWALAVVDGDVIVADHYDAP